MAKNVPGATFVADGIKYVLKIGPKGNLRPYTVGPVAAAGAGFFGLPLLGIIAVGAGVLVATAVVVACMADESSAQ
ncbi:MAG TPA: hypothetical protein VGG19_13075 [Tepidisphaeraceae bacterium]|jgi:hypothetical protein